MAGYDNGDVKLFDLRAMKLRWETTLPNGVRLDAAHGARGPAAPSPLFTSIRLCPPSRPGFALCQVCSLQFDRQDIPMNKLLVTGLESKFHVFDMRTYHEEEGYASVSEKVE